ncbi:hypothetical protein [Sphingobacterium sp. HMA12]|uniref:hypothetical protein n=1 Tax=Sphingobacterium sp. HMA12 TaxID=2050894 RepID=UPI000CE9D545|nr:hypothetical protein [Sphingobacterium sp. HMA12]
MLKKINNRFNFLSSVEKGAVLLSIILFIASLAMPAFFIDRPNAKPEAMDSLTIVLTGWMYPLGGAIIPFLFWCANPIYLFSICTVLNRNKKAAFYISLVPCLIALAFTQMDKIMASESGSESAITSLAAGYFLWLSSFLVLTIGVGVKLKKK